jgi:hypothetical protein
MKIYMATWLQEANQKASLDFCQKRERLLSFYLIKIETKTTLKEYMKNES